MTEFLIFYFDVNELIHIFIQMSYAYKGSAQVGLKETTW